MSSLIVGVVGFLAIFYAVLGHREMGIFLNTEAILVVVCGSFAILAVSNPTRSLLDCMRVFRILFGRSSSPAEINKSLVEIGRNRNASPSVSHPLIDYAQGIWEQGLDPDTALLLIKQRMDQLNGETSSVVSTLRNLSKYPPALGMTGTVMGLVHLFANLTPEARSQIGPNLALAMTSTFYGLLFANALVMPIADRIQVIHHEKSKENKLIFRILSLIHDGQPSLVIREEVYGKSA